jgi:hypothetical protein
LCSSRALIRLPYFPAAFQILYKAISWYPTAQ